MSKRFTTGPKDLRDKFNRDRNDLDTLLGMNLRGDGIIEVKHVGQGQTLRLSITQLLRRIAHAPKASLRHGHAHGLSSVPVFVLDSTVTVITIDFFFSDPDNWYDVSQSGYVVPVKGVYFVSAAFHALFGAHTDIPAFARTIGGTGEVMSPEQVTLPAAAGKTAMTFHLNGMVQLEKDGLLQFAFWHEAGGANTIRVGAAGFANHASIWLIDRL